MFLYLFSRSKFKKDRFADGKCGFKSVGLKLGPIYFVGTILGPPVLWPNQWRQRRKDNRIIGIYGAGDGNRTHVRSLGSFFAEE
jgi:hypothetical protein